MQRQLDRSGRHLEEGYQGIAAKAKKAAADTTSVLNEMISRDTISTSPSMLYVYFSRSKTVVDLISSVTATMNALPIYVWEIRNSTGLARSYAYHQLELYLMILSHLGKTYWTADLQHNLLVEAFKVLDGGPSCSEKDLADSAHLQHPNDGTDLPSTGTGDVTPADNSFMNGTLEDFLLSFNPFMGLPMQPDELG